MTTKLDESKIRVFTSINYRQNWTIRRTITNIFLKLQFSKMKEKEPKQFHLVTKKIFISSKLLLFIVTIFLVADLSEMQELRLLLVYATVQ